MQPDSTDIRFNGKGDSLQVPQVRRTFGLDAATSNEDMELVALEHPTLVVGFEGKILKFLPPVLSTGRLGL